MKSAKVFHNNLVTRNSMYISLNSDCDMKRNSHDMTLRKLYVNQFILVAFSHDGGT